MTFRNELCYTCGVELHDGSRFWRVVDREFVPYCFSHSGYADLNVSSEEVCNGGSEGCGQEGSGS